MLHAAERGAQEATSNIKRSEHENAGTANAICVQKVQPSRSATHRDIGVVLRRVRDAEVRVARQGDGEREHAQQCELCMAQRTKISDRAEKRSWNGCEPKKEQLRSCLAATTLGRQEETARCDSHNKRQRKGNRSGATIRCRSRTTNQPKEQAANESRLTCSARLTASSPSSM